MCDVVLDAENKRNINEGSTFELQHILNDSLPCIVIKTEHTRLHIQCQFWISDPH